jgi:hypothetical protein
MIDTENGRGELYVGATIGGTKIEQFIYGRINAPYTPAKYIEAIKALEEALGEGGVIIIDSLSHAWAGEGGLLEQQGREADRGGNSFAAWRKVTPEHNRLVDSLIQSKCHIMATMRSKTEYTQVEDERGKKQVKKLGMAPIQRDGMEYEFTIFFDIDANHCVSPSKDNTNLFDNMYFKPTVETGKAILAWLETGSDTPAPEQPKPEPTKVTPPAESHDNAATPITDADVESLLKESVKHEGGWEKVGEMLNTRGMPSLEGKSKDEKKATYFEYLKTKFTRNEFDTLVKQVKALPFKSQANRGGNA